MRPLPTHYQAATKAGETMTGKRLRKLDRAWKRAEQRMAEKAQVSATPGEVTSKHGECRDCAQGILGPVHAGFALYQEPGVAFWYCCYCGSNHVTVCGQRQEDMYQW